MNGGEHLIRIEWMPAHDHPFFLGQRTGFLQDLIRDAHLAHIVQQGAAADMQQFFIRAASLRASRTAISVTRWV